MTKSSIQKHTPYTVVESMMEFGVTCTLSQLCPLLAAQFRKISYYP